MTSTPAMIFAAGFGTRMAPLTDTQPKPLIKVAGKALLDHTLELAQGAACDPILVNTHYRADQIADHLRGSAIHISHEPEILDTGGGLKAALPQLGHGPVFTMNSDAIWVGDNPFEMLRSAWQPAMSALLLLAPIDRVTGRDAPGDFSIASDRRITRGGDYVYLGAQIINTNVLDTAPNGAFSLNLIWDDLMACGAAYGCLYDGGWCDVGRPENIATAEDMLARADV